MFPVDINIIEVVLLCLSKYLNIDVVAAQHIKGERIKGRDLHF